MAFEQGDIVTCIENPSEDYNYTTPGVTCFVVDSDEIITNLFVTNSYPKSEWFKIDIYDGHVWEVETKNFKLVKKHFNTPFSKIKTLLR